MMNNTTRILLVICGVALNCCAIAAWAFAAPAHGSKWLLLVALLGILGPTSTIVDCKSGREDQETLQLAVGYFFFLPLVAAGCWLFSPGTPNSNCVLVLFVLASLGGIYGCKKLGSKIE
jgi:hypothetical protein